jgi:cytochrome c oxidase subunit 2
VLVICAGIFLTVGGLLAYTIIRFRRRPADSGREPPQVYGSSQIELAWTVAPILIVFVLIPADRGLGGRENSDPSGVPCPQPLD